MLTIGKLGAAAGVKVPTIRYYEQIGLLPDAERSTGNQRLYSRAVQDRLAFIRHARELGAFHWTQSAISWACPTAQTSPVPRSMPSPGRS